MLMEREIRELVRREVEEQKGTIESMVDDSVDQSLDKTERAMERLSNEKISAIGEYSDTVMNDIHKNHDEVMFMYDMLNDKHKNLTSVVSEVTKKTDEARQAVRDAEATAKEAQVATNNLKVTTTENVRAVLLDENDDKLSGIRIPYNDKENYKNQASGLQKTVASHSKEEKIAVKVESGYVDEKDVKELQDIPAEIISSDEASMLHVIGSNASPHPVSNKVVPITEAIRSEVRTANPDKTMKELTANDPISQNRQIIEMHKAGKSNMVIARELGLGIGEVKLVIDLSNKHRKVR